jgi:hypothetical protein
MTGHSVRTARTDCPRQGRRTHPPSLEGVRPPVRPPVRRMTLVAIVVLDLGLLAAVLLLR